MNSVELTQHENPGYLGLHLCIYFEAHKATVTGHNNNFEYNSEIHMENPGFYQVNHLQNNYVNGVEFIALVAYGSPENSVADKNCNTHELELLSTVNTCLVGKVVCIIVKNRALRP